MDSAEHQSYHQFLGVAVEEELAEHQVIDGSQRLIMDINFDFLYK